MRDSRYRLYVRLYVKYQSLVSFNLSTEVMLWCTSVRNFTNFCRKAWWWISIFRRMMLCCHGICCGPVSICAICLWQVGVLPEWLNIEPLKQCCTIYQRFSAAKDLDEICQKWTKFGRLIEGLCYTSPPRLVNFGPRGPLERQNSEGVKNCNAFLAHRLAERNGIWHV